MSIKKPCAQNASNNHFLFARFCNYEENVFVYRTSGAGLTKMLCFQNTSDINLIKKLEDHELYA